MTLTRYGDVTVQGKDALLYDLTPPIHAGTEISFEAMDGPAYSATGPVGNGAEP